VTSASSLPVFRQHPKTQLSEHIIMSSELSFSSVSGPIGIFNTSATLKNYTDDDDENDDDNV